MQDRLLASASTEAVHRAAHGLDMREDSDILSILHRSQLEAVQAISQSIPALEKGAAALEAALRAGGNIGYAAAGSSAIQALADGVEISPTFAIPDSRINIMRAGGFENITCADEGAEDDASAAVRDAEVIGPKDCVICLAASGNTIYPVTIMEIAMARGAIVIGMSNNPDAKLLEADIPVLLPTPPEVISGSTRLGAATAQKVALNLMSTLLGIRMGGVVDGMMVNVIPSNIKLKARAARIVQSLTGCEYEIARSALESADWQAKEAALVLNGAKSVSDAKKYLDKSGQNYRAALAEMNGVHPPQPR